MRAKEEQFAIEKKRKRRKDETRKKDKKKKIGTACVKEKNRDRQKEGAVT